MTQLQLALKPALADIKLDWGTLKVIQSPTVLPPFFLGTRLIIYGMLEKDAPDVATNITFKVTQAKKGEIAHTMAIDTAHVYPGAQGVKLAARACIKDMEDGKSLVTKNVNETMLALSVDTGILSKLTAFIVVDKHEKPITGEMKTVEGKVMTPEIKEEKKGLMEKFTGL